MGKVDPTLASDPKVGVVALLAKDANPVLPLDPAEAPPPNRAVPPNNDPVGLAAILPKVGLPPKEAALPKVLPPTEAVPPKIGEPNVGEEPKTGEAPKATLAC